MKALVFVFFSFSVFAQLNPNNQAQLNPKFCQLFSHCNNGYNPLWHSIEMGSDLADEVVNEVLIENNKSSESHAVISIPSTGFDTAHSDKTLSQDVNVSKAVDSAGDPNVDITGEGTALTGIVLAKDLGLTRFAKVNVLRVNNEYEKYITSNHLLSSIQKSCKDSDIVVLSWGRIDEVEYLLKEDWYQYASNNGCLIIKSLGLFDHADKTQYLPIESPVLTVSALDSEGQRDEDSHDAMVYAPASQIYTLLSDRAEVGIFAEDRMCYVNEVPYIRSLKDSNVASVVASSAAQVITILKARGVYPSDNKLKLSLVKKILIAASKYSQGLFGNEASLSAYIATLLAKNITLDYFNKDIKDFYSLLDRDRTILCNAKVKDCEQVTDCNEKYSCVKNLRKRVQLCKESLVEDLEFLSKSLISMNEKKLAYSYLVKRFNLSVTLDLKDSAIRDYQKTYLNTLWNNRSNNRFGITVFEDALEALLNAKKLDFKDLHNVENFIELIYSKTLYQMDIYDSNYPEQEQTQRLINGKRFSELYLTFSTSQRAEIVENLITSFQKGMLSQDVLRFVFQMYSSENLASSNSRKLRKLIVDITHNFLRIDSSFNKINLSRTDLNYILYKFPKLVKNIKSKIKSPYLFLNKEILDLAFDYPETFLSESKEQIATHMLYELFERKEDLFNEIKQYDNYRIIEGKVYEKLQQHIAFILIYSIRSHNFDQKVVDMINELITWELPLMHANPIIPTFKPFSSQKIFVKVLEQESFVNNYLKRQFDLLQKSFDLEGVIDTSKFQSYSYNISRTFLSNEHFLNNLPYKLDKKLQKDILKTIDLAIERLKIDRSDIEQATMDLNTSGPWRLSAMISEQAIVDFIKMAPSFEKVDALKGLAPLFKDKIEKLFELSELDEVSLGKYTLEEIKIYLKHKE